MRDKVNIYETAGKVGEFVKGSGKFLLGIVVVPLAKATWDLIKKVKR